MFAHLAGFRRLVAKKLDLNIAKVGMQRYRLGSRELYPPKHMCRPCEARDEENASLLLFGASFFIEISDNDGPCSAAPCLWRNTIDNKAETYVRRPNIALRRERVRVLLLHCTMIVQLSTERAVFSSC